MGATFENLTWDDLCDLMCGGPEMEYEDYEEDFDSDDDIYNVGWERERECQEEQDNKRHD